MLLFDFLILYIFPFVTALLARFFCIVINGNLSFFFSMFGFSMISEANDFATVKNSEQHPDNKNGEENVSHFLINDFRLLIRD